MVNDEGKAAMRLREDDVRQIRVRLRDVACYRSTIRAVAREFGVSETTIRRIRDGKAWAHVACTCGVSE